MKLIVLFLILPVTLVADPIVSETKLPTGTIVPMVLVPAGEFTMGSTTGPADQQPTHVVLLDSFYIDQYEVTNAEYMEYVRDTGYHAPMLLRESNYNAPEQPVLDISWFEMQMYCNWAGKRLPTEAEWEKAARGTDGRANPWGDEAIDAAGIYRANYNDFGNRDADGYIWTAPVGSYPQGISPYGAYDMVGNVKEWVFDWYRSAYYDQSPHYNPKGPSSGEIKVIRGGSWFDFPTFVSGTYRSQLNPELPDGDIGGRCAASVDAPVTAVDALPWGMIKKTINNRP